MISSFRKPFTVRRAGIGSFNESGIFVPSTEQSLQILASIQPATTGDYDTMQAETGGERFKRLIRVYTDAVLSVGDPRGNIGTSIPVADVIIYPFSPGSGPGRYRVVRVAPWQSGVIPHYRYIAVGTLMPEDINGGSTVTPPGIGAANSYVFTQSTPSATWDIIHNMQSFPAVTVVDSAGQEIEGDVRFVSANEVVVSFSSACAGSAYLN